MVVDESEQIECQWCGILFDPRGLGEHEKNCDEKPKNTPGEEPEQEGGAPEGEGSGDAKGRDVLVCPDCGNHDNGERPLIVYSDSDAERELIDSGPLTEEDRGLIRKHDYICIGCSTLFSEVG